jgi:DNA-binding CsgD family transcriptional regulator
MKNRLAKALGLVCYLVILCLLFGLDGSLFLKPKPLVSVILGMLILSACQYRKGMTPGDVMTAMRWNVILAGFLTTLFSVFSSPDIRLGDIEGLRLTEHLLPLLYASILYILLWILQGDKPRTKQEDALPEAPDLTATETAEKVFRVFSLTKRECHVAQMLLRDVPNKVIAADLYISEATVKKHIQNIYQKTGASDRSGFRDICYEHARRVK